MMTALTMSFGNKVTSNKVVNRNYTIDQLIEYFSQPKKISFSYDDYIALSKEEAMAIKKQLPFWSGSHYKVCEEDNSAKRRADHITRRNILSFDIDYAESTQSLSNLIGLLEYTLKCAYVIHSTISYAPENGNFKYRVIIPTSTDIVNDLQYKAAFHFIADQCDIGIFDEPTSTDPARAMFAPARLIKQDYVLKTNSKLPFFDLSLLPSVPTEAKKVLKRTFPSTLSGIEGVYNSLYSCPYVLYRYALDQYAPSNEYDPLDITARWSYKLGTGKDGVRFEDNGELLHSEHSTDPLFMNKVRQGRKQWSAYELYVYFAHRGNFDAANNEISQDPDVLAKISKDFQDIESYIAEHHEQEDRAGFNAITWQELIAMRDVRDPQVFIDFVLCHGFAMMNKTHIDLVFPIKKFDENSLYKKYENEQATLSTRISFKHITVGSQAHNFFGACGEFVHPTNPKKQISALDYLFKFSTKLKFYDGYVFAPFNKYTKNFKLPEFVDDINMFFGYSVEPTFNFSDEDVNATQLQVVLDYILKIVCNGDQKANIWVLDWIADIVQNPADKPGTALVLYSVERGVGKSTLFLLFKAMLGALAQPLPSNILDEKFNSNLEYCLLGFLDDMSFQLKKDAAKMRNVVTAEYRLIEKKHFNRYEVKDCTRYLITSNHKHIVDIDANVEERRYTLLQLHDHFKHQPLTNRMSDAERDRIREYNTVQDSKKTEYFKTLVDCILNNGNLLLGYFLSRNITSNLRKMYSTTLYEEVSAGNMSKMDSFLSAIRFMHPEELCAYFSDDFTGSDTVVDITEEHVCVPKKVFREVFASESSQNGRCSAHELNQMLRDSTIANTFNIEYAGKFKNFRVYHIFNGKREDTIRIEKSFFENL